MSERPTYRPNALIRLFRAVDGFFDRVHIRPFGLVIFALSAWGLWWMYGEQSTTLRAQAVAQAERVVHGAQADSVVSHTYVKVGDSVEKGQLLAVLTSPLVSHEIALAEAEIASIEQAMHVALAEIDREAAAEHLTTQLERDKALRDLAVAQGQLDAQQRVRRAAEATLKRRELQLQQRLITDSDHAEAADALDLARAAESAARAERDATRAFADALLSEIQRTADDLSTHTTRLKALTEASYQAQAALVEARKRNFQEDQKALRITAKASGRVSQVLPMGSVVTADFPVVEIIPPWATEAVAYLDPSTHPSSVRPGQPVRIASGHCPEQGATITRAGAAVTLAPGQLMSWTGKPIYGLPVHIALPDGCLLGVGQVVEVLVDSDI